MTDPPRTAEELPCPACREPPSRCLCAAIRPIDNTCFVLILQHPREQDRELGTARLALRHFARGRLAVGLSWPNLAKAAGRPAEPRRWGVLYLGSAVLPPEAAPRGLAGLDGAGAPAGEDALVGLDGIVLLDGSWSQAKALWWRNPWLTRLRRIVLATGQPSRYGRLRREPRHDSVSTLEAAAFAMSRVEGRPELEAAMLASFEALLRRYRARRAAPLRRAAARPSA